MKRINCYEELRFDQNPNQSDSEDLMDEETNLKKLSQIEEVKKY